MSELDTMISQAKQIDQLRAELQAEREKVKGLEADIERYKAQQIGLQNINIMNQAMMENELAAAQATIAEMREELAKQEPVAWMNPHGGVLQRLDTGLERETYTIPLYASPVVPDDMVQKLRDILQMLLQEPDTKAALFKAEDMLREVIAAAQESNAGGKRRAATGLKGRDEDEATASV
jgi:DNA repair exonuclease SbcCD ATPase subunit